MNPQTMGAGVPRTAAVPAARGASQHLSTAYVVNGGSDTVTPIATATNTAGPPITAGNGFGIPVAIAITPDGPPPASSTTTRGTVTPIQTATNTADLDELEAALRRRRRRPGFRPTRRRQS